MQGSGRFVFFETKAKDLPDEVSDRQLLEGGRGFDFVRQVGPPL